MSVVRVYFKRIWGGSSLEMYRTWTSFWRCWWSNQIYFSSLALLLFGLIYFNLTRFQCVNEVCRYRCRTVQTKPSSSSKTSDPPAPKTTTTKAPSVKPKVKQLKVKAEPPPKKRKKWKEEFSSSQSDSSPEVHSSSSDDEGKFSVKWIPWWLQIIYVNREKQWCSQFNTVWFFRGFTYLIKFGLAFIKINSKNTDIHIYVHTNTNSRSLNTKRKHGLPTHTTL